MKKGSSGNRKKRTRQDTLSRQRQYPARDNVYELNRIRQERERQNRQQQYTRYPQQRPVQQQTPQQKKKAANRRRHYAGRILPLFVFAVVVVYLMSQLAMMAVKKPEVNVETVAYGTIDTPRTRQGLIVRDEYVVNSDRTGTPFYQYSEGDYVKKAAVVCQVKDTASTDALEDKLASIDKNILESQKNRSDLSVFSEDIERLEKNMAGTVELFGSRSMKTDASYLYAMRTQLDSYLMQRNEIWLSENVEGLSQLNEEKSAYEQQLAQSMSSVSATESGVVAFSYDGLEETLTPEALENLTAAQISGSTDMTPISKVQSVAEGDPLFRVVTSNEWYMMSYFPNQDVIGWETGDVYPLNLIGEDTSVSVNATVSMLTPGESETKVVFTCFTHMSAFINQRMISFSMDSETVQGLKIPNDAIVEKTLLKIPVSCLTESNGVQGVLLVNGTNSKFMETEIVTSDESYVYISQNTQGLKIGDVILNGTGENAEQYTVSEVETSPGVYVANSSMAKFVPIRILDQNQEYAIAQSASTYGLQVYDTIVSDAKNITEGQSIY